MRRLLYESELAMEASAPELVDAVLIAGNDESVADDEDAVAAGDTPDAVLLAENGAEVAVETAVISERAAAMSRAKLPIWPFLCCKRLAARESLVTAVPGPTAQIQGWEAEFTSTEPVDQVVP